MDKFLDLFSKKDSYSGGLFKALEANNKFQKSILSGSLTNLSKSFTSFNSVSSPKFDEIFKIYDAHRNRFPIMEDYLKGIKQSHLDIFSSFERFAQTSKIDIFQGQIKNMETALGGLAFQATSLLSKRQNWDLLEDFDEITNEVADISERVSKQNSIFKADLDDIKRLVHGIEIKIDQKDKDFFSILLKWIAVVSFIVMLMQEKRFLDTKDATLTSRDFDNFKKEIVQVIEGKFEGADQIRVINRNCNLRLKPSSRSLILGTIKEGDEIIVLQTSGKWVFIQVKYDVTTHGWVFKKYVGQ